MPERIQHTPPTELADLLPVRMCNELVYCERLFYLEHVQGYFVDSSDTVQGRAQHDRAARRGRRKTVAAPTPSTDPDPPDPELADPPHTTRRTVTLESSALGVRGQLDLLELHPDEVVVVEAKRGGAPPHDDHAWVDHPLPYPAWPADVVQVGLYMALLREAGTPCERAQILYRKDRRRIEIPWSPALERFVHAVVLRARHTAALPSPPPPLEHSNKCLRCSLHTICLPDEHLALQREAAGQSVPEVRRIVPGRDDRAVLHVVTPGSTLRKDGDGIQVVVRGDPGPRVLTKDVAQVALYGPSQITAQCLNMLLLADVPVAHHTGAGRLLGITLPLSTRNVTLRRAQFRTADDPARCLQAARALVLAKIRNQRTVLRRYRKGTTVDHEPSEELPEWADVPDPDLPAKTEARAKTIADALTRMRNAWRSAERATTLDALRGHEGDAAATYFAALPAVLPPAWQGDLRGRSRRPPRDRVNAMLGFGYALITHPRFGYRMSYRRMLELEARVLAKWMAGEIDGFSPLLTR